MIHERTFLGRALALSLVLHAALFALIAQLAVRAPRFGNPAPVELTVSLRERPVVPEAPLPAPPRLLPQEPPRNPNPAGRTGAAPPPRIAGEAALRAAEQLKNELHYPLEAVERGLQGEALVLLFLDASGNAVAARLEASSGHKLLDEAAVRAARTLRGLPDSAPRDVLLPVRFRLR
jgi:protein TonB